LVVVLFMVLVAAFAPLLAPYDPAAQSWTTVRKAPSALHWMGTDQAGRDMLSRIIWGARASMMAGLTSVGIAMAIGVPLGLAAGFLGGLIDGLISRFTDAMLACPFLILGLEPAHGFIRLNVRKLA
jgi:peptide/nickel transport system permease protein